MISCYVIGELSTVESLCTYITDYPLTTLRGYSVQRPERFDAVYSLRPDIVFIDSALAGGQDNWLERIRQFSSVVLVSPGTEQAFAAFEHFAFDYLIKPVPFNRFVKSINKFEHLAQLVSLVNLQVRIPAIDSFFIKADSKGFKEVLIKCEQLIYIQAMQNYVVLHMENNQRFSCHNSMKEMEDTLCGPSFSRIHKSFIINDEKITSIEGNILIMNGNENEKLPIGNTYRKAFYEKKAQKMIRKQKTGVQLEPYSRLALWLLYTGMAAGMALVSAEIFIQV
ncbi:LytR/AlgR family response regulator transcription factor [Pedobacter sp. GSP4]|uniref:LytR/AlgR family response regulator transcription factor n=1 Tax=Pedobacter sp. GSP4 TaxID=3453716 RepID=UPI003EEA8424